MNLQQLFAVPMPPPREEPERYAEETDPAGKTWERQRGHTRSLETRARMRARYVRQLAEEMLKRPEGHVTRQEAAQAIGSSVRRFNTLVKRHGVGRLQRAGHLAWYSLEELRSAGIIKP